MDPETRDKGIGIIVGAILGACAWLLVLLIAKLVRGQP